MQLSKTQAREILIGVGFPSADTWPIGKLAERLNTFPEWKDATANEPPEAIRGQLANIEQSLQNGENIDVVSDAEDDGDKNPPALASPAPVAEPTKPKTKKKKVKGTVSATATKPAKGVKGAKSAKAVKAAKGATKGTKRQGMSCVNAAYKVLKEARKPLPAKDIVAAMAKKGYWKTSEGKTPENSVAARIYVEIKTKGKEARFRKDERGLFSIN